MIMKIFVNLESIKYLPVPTQENRAMHRSIGRLLLKAIYTGWIESELIY